MFSTNSAADDYVRRMIMQTIKELSRLDDIQYEIEFAKIFQMPKLTGYTSRIQTLIHNINTGAVKIDVLPDVFSHLDKLNELGRETTDNVKVND